MTKISVLGLGNFGTALARNWTLHGKNVCGWTVENEVFESIKATGVNEKYLPSFDLPGMDITMELDTALDGADIVALALPSHVVLDVVDAIMPLLTDDQVLLDLAKGLAPGEELVSSAISQKLTAADRENPLAVMAGPTIAPELAAGVLTTALVASEEEAIAQGLSRELSTPTFEVRFASDPLGIELWGAFKNVIALACGISDGLRQVSSLGGDNLKAAIFTAGFHEGCRTLSALGAHSDTAFGPAGVGDLFVTATSPHGRNRRTGELLGSGSDLETALGGTVMVSEGVRATHMFAERTKAEGIDAPFVAAVLALLDGVVDAETCVRRLLVLDT